jgi:UDP-3-O-[3-hydroxymyristoyl] glucosamine N-acyltransferase
MSPALRAAALATKVGGRVVRGDPEREITRIAPLHHADEHCLSFVAHPKYLPALANSKAGVVLLESRFADAAPGGAVIVEVDNAYVAFARASQILAPKSPVPEGWHASAVVDPAAIVDPTASLGPFVVVGARARLGAGVVAHAGVHIEAGAEIGASSVLESHVVIKTGCQVGARCVLHAGAVIGADGFGFAPRTEGGKLVEHVKIAQTGIVIIEDDVEIGANVCIDRAALGVTRVGRGTKIDNLVQIGHNVDIGPLCILVAQSGVAGSSALEERVTLGAQSGVSGHLRVGAGTLVYGQSGVTDDAPPDSKLGGTPAQDAGQFFRNVVRLTKLGSLFDRVRALERKVFEGKES